MWMPPLEDAWQGKVQFYELLFGTWTAYAFLVVLWQRILKEPLDEWRYVLLSFFGAGAFWVNHYFQQSPFWLWLINLYRFLSRGVVDDRDSWKTALERLEIQCIDRCGCLYRGVHHV